MSPHTLSSDEQGGEVLLSATAPSHEETARPRGKRKTDGRRSLTKRSRAIFKTLAESGNTLTAIVAAVGGVGATFAWLWPTGPSPSLEEAIALAANGRSAEALSVFTRLTEAEPRNAIVHANLCGLQLQLNYLSEARRSCATAVALAPGSWLANYNHACVLTLEGRANEAIEALQRALADIGDEPGARLSRAGLAARAVGDPMLRSLKSDARFKTLMGAQ